MNQGLKRGWQTKDQEAHNLVTLSLSNFRITDFRHSSRPVPEEPKSNDAVTGPVPE